MFALEFGATRATWCNQSKLCYSTNQEQRNQSWLDVGEECVTSPKKVCVGGYDYGDTQKNLWHPGYQWTNVSKFRNEWRISGRKSRYAFNNKSTLLNQWFLIFRCRQSSYCSKGTVRGLWLVDFETFRLFLLNFRVFACYWKGAVWFYWTFYSISAYFLHGIWNSNYTLNLYYEWYHLNYDRTVDC